MFQPTYLKEWYTTGFNTAEMDAEMAARHPDKLIVNGRFDPRDGDPGLRQLEEDHAKFGLKGVKLYTAEWNAGSRGYKLDDAICAPFFEKCIELGIKNIHVHKGPTIWPLDKDAFDVSDVDKVATRYQELNFIVEHVGLPRIEDFCFMATQERNVYAGLAVVIGGLMHARPRFFAKVMGELLFWVGEDKMLFGADYAIWEPKWQVEGLVDWNYPDETFSDFPAFTTESKKKILGLNAAKLYDVEVPEELQLANGDAGGTGGRAAGRRRRVTDRAHVLDALGTVYDPELDEPITSLRFVTSCDVSADGDVDVRLRLPTPQCAPNFAFLMAADARDAVRRLPEVREVTVVLEDHYTGSEINGAVNRGDGVRRGVPRRDRGRARRAARAVPPQGARRAPVAAVRVAAGRRRDTRGGDARRPWRTSPTTTPARVAASSCASTWASRVDDDAPGVRPARRRADHGRRADPLAADGEARADEPRGQRRHLPLAAAPSATTSTTPRRSAA